jgi:hypothetical protein
MYDGETRKAFLRVVKTTQQSRNAALPCIHCNDIGESSQMIRGQTYCLTTKTIENDCFRYPIIIIAHVHGSEKTGVFRFVPETRRFVPESLTAQKKIL